MDTLKINWEDWVDPININENVNILLYGGKGFIGTMFTSYLDHMKIHYLLGNERCDTMKVKQEIIDSNCNRVVCLIGRTKGPNELDHLGSSNTTIDYLEDKLPLNLNDNLFSPLLLERICNDLHIHFTYMGTGCIYYTPLHEDRIYQKDDDPNFFGSSYSIVKGFTDKYMRYVSSNSLNVRIRMPVTSLQSSKNLLNKILSYTKICQTGPNSMTVLEEAIPRLVDHIINSDKGTIHLVNPGPMKHCEILDLYKEIVDPKFHYITMDEQEQDTLLKAKRSVCVLEPGSPPLQPLKDSVIKIFTSWSKNKQN